MDHIHAAGGRFVSVLPATRKEDRAFRDWIVDHQPVWTEAARRPSRRADGPDEVWHNDRTLTDAGVLAAYKYQPNLEKRYSQLKGTQLVTPMFLRDPARIEALLCCHFLAMLVQALIERHIRTAMADRGLAELSLYPEDRGCPAPTTARILQIFNSLSRHHLRDDHGRHVQTFHPELTDLQRQVLDLLDIPTTAYTPTP